MRFFVHKRPHVDFFLSMVGADFVDGDKKSTSSKAKGEDIDRYLIVRLHFNFQDSGLQI